MAEVVVPLGEDSEQPKEKPKTDGETRRAEEQRTRQQEARDIARREAEKKSSFASHSAEASRDKKATEGKPETSQKPPIEISFKDAKAIAEVVTAIQDEKQVIISPEELASFKKILTRYGNFEAKAVNKMTEAEIVVATQTLLKNAKIAEPEKSDWDYEPGSENQKVEEALAKKQIVSAQSSDEETLTVEKVNQYLQVEEFGRATEQSGPGTMQGPDGFEEMPEPDEVSPQLGRYIREIQRISRSVRPERVKYQQLQNVENTLGQAILAGELDDTDVSVQQVREILSGRINTFLGGEEARGLGPGEAEARKNINDLLTTTGAEWDEAKARVDSMMAKVKGLADATEPANYQEAYYVTKAIKESFVLNPDAVAKLPQDVCKQIESFIDAKTGLLAKLNEKYQEKFDKLTKDAQQALIGDIDREATTYFKQIAAGWGVTVEDARENLRRMISEDPTGLREWRVMISIEGLDDAVRVRQLTEVPVIEKEIPQKIANVYTFMESTDLSVDELNVTIQEAINLVRQIRPDDPKSRELRGRLIKELEAFRAFHSLRITLERHDGDPTNLTELYRSYFDDETFVNFVARFGRDERERQFLDKDGNPVNLLDTGFELYSEKLKKDRIDMNIMEEMTRHAIGKSFDRATLRKFEQWLGIPLTDDLRHRIEELRGYFFKKMQAKIDATPKLRGRPVDDVWGRKEMTIIDEKEVSFLGITKDLIQDWYTKKTLQGAFGLVMDSEEDRAKGKLTDIDLLMEEFRITDRDKARKRFLGKSFLAIRRDQLLEQLAASLGSHDLDLKIKVGQGEDESLREVNLEDLRKAGFLESVDNNAYYLTWIIEWSNYDSIRIYSRDSKSKLHDDYDHLVFNQATNLFFGRQIDQSWEFYHEQNENRGRSKENDVNRIWKNFLPGKHNWLFPQNSIMGRWADFFMTDKQKTEVEKRTRELMSQHDFDNEKYHDEFVSWMKNVVVRDMIESGEISFGKDAGRKFSDVANAVKLRKFEFIDVFIDRTSHKKFTDPQILQDYLANPTEDKFAEINDKVKAFYSTRDARLFPWMTLALRAHWEIANHHSMELFDRPNLQSASMENFVARLVNEGYVEKGQGNDFKKRYLAFIPFIERNLPLPARHALEIFGTIPFRRLIRQPLEVGRRLAWESKFSPLAIIAAMVAEFFKQLAKETGRQR